MKKKTYITVGVMALILLIAVFFVNAREAEDIKNMVIVIDAGHGGSDPGKVGTNKAKETDVNLKIAFMLEEKLKERGCQVIMTRVDSSDLSKPGVSNKKASDLNERIRIMDEAKPDIIISIHQNSFGDSSVKGAQVFYHSQSQDGKKLAESLQKALVEGLDKNNKRQAKAGDTYYLLKKSTAPAVIVECGFLSNPTEAALLVDKVYQEKIVDSIIQGIIYYNN